MRTRLVWTHRGDACCARAAVAGAASIALTTPLPSATDEKALIRDRWPILPGQRQVAGGAIAVPDSPALGIEVDEPLVRRLAQMHDVEVGL